MPKYTSSASSVRSMNTSSAKRYLGSRRDPDSISQRTSQPHRSNDPIVPQRNQPAPLVFTPRPRPPLWGGRQYRCVWLPDRGTSRVQPYSTPSRQGAAAFNSWAGRARDAPRCTPRWRQRWRGRGCWAGPIFTDLWWLPGALRRGCPWWCTSVSFPAPQPCYNKNQAHYFPYSKCTPTPGTSGPPRTASAYSNARRPKRNIWWTYWPPRAGWTLSAPPSWDMHHQHPPISCRGEP